MQEQDKSAFMTWYRNGCQSGTMEDAKEKFQRLPFGAKRALVEERQQLLTNIEENRSERNKAWNE